MKVFCSWSGGKDSCLSCYKAMLEGHEVAYLFTMLATTGKYTRSHRLSKELLLAQAEAMGIPVYHRRASWNTYEREFKRALAFFKRKGIQGGIFGDLHVNEHREWVERVCAQSGVIPLLPLWGIAGRDLLGQFIGAGFEALVIAVKDGLLGTEWLGRRIDQQFMNEMTKEASDICGENGEYHTLIVDGPVFRKKIGIRDTRLVRRNKVSFLEILNSELEEKGLEETCQ
jgi:diphthine-ammonia ligase